ncbi:MAG: hypothetical protein QXG00_07675, partial [Candidatus Woesearchaeota archaeon]
DNEGRVTPWTEYGKNISIDQQEPIIEKIQIEGGQEYTKNTEVHLTINAYDNGQSGLKEMRFSNDGSIWSDWEEYKDSKVWLLDSGSGIKNVYVEVKDNAGNISGSNWDKKGDFEKNINTTNENVSKQGIEITGNNEDDDSSLILSTTSGNITSFSAGRWYNSAALDVFGNLWVTGRNIDGELGLGHFEDVNTWTKVNFSDIKKFYLICSNLVILKNDGTLWATGDNYHYTLGNLDEQFKSNNLIQISSDISDMWAGGHTIIIKKNDNTYWGIGNNEYGQLGTGERYTDFASWQQIFLPNYDDPSQVIKDIKIGEENVYVLFENGDLYGAGSNYSGQLAQMQFDEGLANFLEIYENVDEIFKVQDSTVFIKDKSGIIWGVGNNSSGELGLGDTDSRSFWTEISIPGANIVKASSGTGGFSYLLDSNGYLWSTGNNDSGQLGLGDNEQRLIWTKTSINNVLDFDVSGYHLMAKKNNNNIYVVGSNLNGQLGLGYPMGTYDYDINIAENSTPSAYLTSGLLGGGGDLIGLRFYHPIIQKWDQIYFRGSYFNPSKIKFAVKTSNDGINWSDLLGRDGKQIDWENNFLGCDNNLGCFLSLNNIPASKYIDLTVKLESDGSVTPVLKNVSLYSASFDSIELDMDNPQINFDPNNKYPNSNWNVKENSNSVELRFSTNKETVSYVDFGKSETTDQADGSPKYSTNHYVIVKNLKPGESFKYKIRVIDRLGNMITYPNDGDLNPKSSYVFTTVQPVGGFDGSPLVSSVSQAEISATSAKITWRTKVPSSSYVDYGLTTSYGTTAGSDALTLDHVVELKNLVAGNTYHYRIRGVDAEGNESVSSDYTFLAIAKPEVKEVNVLETKPYSVKIAISTNIAAEAIVSYGELEEEMSEKKGSDTQKTYHEIELKELKDDVTYYYKVDIKDIYGNSASSKVLTFKTPIDKDAPKISEVKITPLISSNSNKRGVIVNWVTDKESDTQVAYTSGITLGQYDKKTPLDQKMVRSHTVVINDLEPGTTYHFKLYSRDIRNNLGESDDYVMLTQEKDESVLQLILKTLENTFSWVGRIGGFFTDTFKGLFSIN